MFTSCLLRTAWRMCISLPVSGHSRACLREAGVGVRILAVQVQTLSSILPSPYKNTGGAKLDHALTERARFLSQTFSGSEEEVRVYLTEHPHLLTMGIAKFCRISQLLRDHGISLREVMTYPEVYKRKFETLRSRIKKLQDGGIEKVTLTMINTTWTEYHKKSRRLIQDQETKEEYGSLLELLSRRLHIAPDIAANIASQHLWLQHSKLSTIKDKLDVLEAYHVPGQEVEARPWVLALSVEELEEQLWRLRQEGLAYGSLREGVAYLSLIKLSPQNFPRTLERRRQEREILGNCHSTTEYLCHRLGCSEQDVRECMQRSNPALLAVSPRKMAAVLDFVLEELRLPAQDVVAHAKVFSFGLPRLRERLEELSQHGITPSVKLLALDSRAYRRLMEKLELSAS